VDVHGEKDKHTAGSMPAVCFLSDSVGHVLST
jgi:hypothetical protein